MKTKQELVDELVKITGHGSCYFLDNLSFVCGKTIIDISKLESMIYLHTGIPVGDNESVEQRFTELFGTRATEIVKQLLAR